MIRGINVSQYPITSGLQKQIQLIEYLMPFDVVRFMDWTQDHIGTKDVHNLPNPLYWQDAYRGPWDKFRGVPYEYMVQIANIVDARPWVTIPYAASDTLINHIVQTVIENSIHRPIFEYSNEIWNSADIPFQANETFKERQENIIELARKAGFNDWQSYQIHQTNKIADMVTGVGDVVINRQFYGDVPEIELKENVFMAVAPYIGQRLNGFEADTAVAIEHQLMNEAIPKMKEWYHSYGDNMVAYEGGLHLVSNQHKEKYFYFNRSRAAGELTCKLWHNWNNITNNSLACGYSIVTEYVNNWNKMINNHFFGHAELIGNTFVKTFKYDALL